MLLFLQLRKIFFFFRKVWEPHSHTQKYEMLQQTEVNSEEKTSFFLVVTISTGLERGKIYIKIPTVK